MPFWGRPPGARPGRKTNIGWSKRRWQEGRVEELSESDDDDEEGVELDFGGRGFSSDELHFTGFDIGSAVRRRPATYDSEVDEDYPEEDVFGQDAGPDAQVMQLTLREKEDFLVDRAMDRIRRAQALGKTNVKLTPQEIAALDSRSARTSKVSAGPSQPRSKKASSKAKAEPKKKSKGDKSNNSSPRLAAVDPRRSGRSSLSNRSDTQPPYPSLPPDLYSGGGAFYYPPVRPSSSSSRPSSRNASSQSLRQQLQSVPVAAYPQAYGQPRYYSVPESSRARRPSSSSSRASSRPDPADPNWEPRARSSSTVLPYPLDPPQYQPYLAQPLPQHFDPRDPRFAPPARRVASGPPDVYPGQASSTVYYRHPHDELFMMGGSDPNLVGSRRAAATRVESSGAETSSSTDDDSNQGVQVEVVERPAGGYDVQTRSGTSSSGSKSKASAAQSQPKRRKGKR